jgi:hypothetical protein
MQRKPKTRGFFKVSERRDLKDPFVSKEPTNVGGHQFLKPYPRGQVDPMIVGAL